LNMGPQLTVKPSKNVFLLYAMLDALDQGIGSVKSHPLRKLTKKHFENYEKIEIGLNARDYWSHPSVPASYTLTLKEAPGFSNKEVIQVSQSAEKIIHI